MTSSKTFLYCCRYLYLIICAVFLSACASSSTIRLYEGSKRPDNEVVKFLVPSALEVVAIDGQEPDTPYLLDDQYQLELLPGEHTLKVIYEEYWGDNASGTVEVSSAFNFQLATTAGSVYTFKHNGPTDLAYADSEGQISDIRIWLEQRQTGQTINATSTSTYGSYIVRKFRQVITTGTEQGRPVAVNNAVQKNDAKKTAATSPAILQVPAKQDTSSTLLAEQIIAQQNALERLKLWWKMADEKQRKAFRIWIIGEPAFKPGQK